MQVPFHLVVTHVLATFADRLDLCRIFNFATAKNEITYSSDTKSLPK
jgi:hypothetical protein